ncbi:MAG TPA: cupin domain-containing protein [Pirellulales bacterium]|nr:cupin domain-containing protein [Pirellulales bacterium]
MSERFKASLPLERLLSPVESAAFFRDSWEKRPLAVHRRQTDYYADLLSMRDVDEIVAFTRPKFAEPEGFSSSTYIRGLPADSPAAANAASLGTAQVRQAFDQGKSIVIMAMQQRRGAVAALCRGLETTFGCPVHANMYLTPQGSQGFAAHFDSHEVFVLQLEGGKHWRLFDAAEELPLANSTGELRRRPAGVPRDVRLEAGDLLYIPRGHVHEAFAAERASLHLTVGVNVYRWVELLHHALSLAAEQDKRFRESIPGGALLGDKAEIKANFEQLLGALASRASAEGFFDRAAESLGDQFFGQLKMLPGSQFAAEFDLDRIALDSVLEKSPHALCRVVEKADGAAIEFPGNRVGGPQRIGAALRFIARATRFEVRELPDDLNADGKLVLARRLVREGLLSVVDAPAAMCADRADEVHQATAKQMRPRGEARRVRRAEAAAES